MATKKSGCRKFAIATGVVVIATGAIFATVEPVRNWVVDKFKSEEQKQEEKKEELKEQIKNDDRYKELEDDNKQKVEDKFEQITNSEKYNEMTDEEKDEIVDKLIESEKIQQEAQKEQEEQETRKEELKQELEDLSSNKQELEQRVQDLKDSGATDEEIKAAEEEQQKVEEQIKAAEQEQTYFETVDTVKDSAAQNSILQTNYPGTSIQKVWGIYKCGGSLIYVNADILQKETIAGVDIYTKANALCRIMIIIPEETTEAILKCISNPNSFRIESICTNKNDESHKIYFEQNKQTMCHGTLKRCEDQDCEISVLETWEEDNDSEHPSFLLRVTRGQTVDMLQFLSYEKDLGDYRLTTVEKICPEFWAQLETEQAEEQNENLKNLSEFATLDSNGNTISFDYSAYLSKLTSQQTSNQQTSQKSYLFSDELER